MIVSSSSDTSEASEDSVAESNPETPSGRRGGFAAMNNMSARQTWKVNAGRFGMFNPPTLLPDAPRTPGMDKKRKRAKEYSDYQESPQQGQRTTRRRRQEVIELSDEDEAERNLSVSEDTTSTDPANAEDKHKSRHMYPRARQYLNILDLVKTAETHVRIAESALCTGRSEHKGLEWKLATIDAAAKNAISDILRERDEVVRIANEHAEAKIDRIRQRVPAKKTEYEEKLYNVAEVTKSIGERTVELRADLNTLKDRKAALERYRTEQWCSQGTG